MSQLILNLTEGRQQRDKGIAKAESSANAAVPEWAEKAYTMFCDWLSGWASGYCFTIEQFRQVAQIRGLETPPSQRAFGGLAVRAKTAGLIRSNGTVKVKNPKAHCANASLWQKV